MAEHIWSVLCDSAIFDKESGRVSLINAIERVGILKDSLEGLEGQGVYRPMHFVSMWRRSDVEQPETGGKVRVTLRAPDGTSLQEQPYDLEQLRDFAVYRVRIQLMGIPSFRGLGEYSFLVELHDADGGWEPVARCPFLVAHDPQPDSEDREDATEDGPAD